MRQPVILISILLSAILLACTPDKAVDPAVDQLGRAGDRATLEDPHAGVDRTVAPPPLGNEEIHVGTVQETIDVPNYTYIRFKTETGDEKWAAVFTGKFAIGATVSIAQSLVMTSFKSTRLNRTFDSVIFGSVVQNANAASAPADDSSTAQPQ